MNVKGMALCIFFLIALLSKYSNAGMSGYECIVQQELHLTNEGELKPYPNPLQIGKHFSIHRETGTLVESTPSFWSPKDAKVLVHSKGNSENGFVASYIAPAALGGVHITVLQIQEYEKGLMKPFMLTSGGGIYTGTCK